MFRLALLFSVSVGFVVLAALVLDVMIDGASRVSLDFITSFPSRISPESTGVKSALIGTIYLMVLCAVFIVPVGVATAVYLEEYANRDSRLSRLIEVNIQNLAAVPSVVYGILGLAFIVRGPLGLGPVLLAGALTLGLLVLPVVIIVSREAIRAVPSSIREGSLALGATQWQTIWKQVLPGALPGIATGVILALSRAIGETAPLLVIGAATFARFNPEGITDRFTAMPLAIFEFISDADTEFRAAGAAAIIVLLALLVVMNAGAIFLRNRYERKW
ncbi:MAG: phosphate ABC transporter permease PstA [Thermoleophilaceae bacterium]|nr:phosphate ABC transporter permease PstA [Thermoleophilaceae bacterium]